MAGNPEIITQTGNVDGTVRTVKKCTSEKHLFNNGIEVTASSDGRNQVMEDAKWHLHNLRLFNYILNLRLLINYNLRLILKIIF